MPPKKKNSKKGKKGKKSGTKISAKESSKSEHLSELSKEFYLIQIRDLENRLARYQKKCDELEVANAEFKKEYEQISSNTKEVVAFLKKSLRERGDEISDLNDRLIGLQQARESEKEQFDTKYHQLQVTMQEVKDTLTSENMILGGKLASLEEFKVQKEDLMKKFEMMEASLADQKKSHEEFIYNLERKQVVDKDRLKKEMVSRVNQVASEFRKVSNKQMAETTKRTIRENVSINTQLAKMSDKTMELIEENDELKGKEKAMKQQVDLLEANEKELAKKNHSNLKVIRMLTEKCKSQEALIADFEMRESEFQEMEKENVMLGQQVESSREESQNLSEHCERLQCELEDVKKNFTTEKKGKIKLEKVLAEAAIAIKGALVQNTSEDVEQSAIEQMERRDIMLENLLVLLNSAAAIGIGPSPGDFLGRKSPSSKLPGSGRGIRRGDMSPSNASAVSGPSMLPHYRLGDLGIIPRPEQHILSHSEKVKEAAQTPHPPPPKNTKSVGVQTISAPKTMFFADQLLSRLPNTSQLIHEFSTEKTTSTFPIIQGTKPASAKAY